MAIAFPPLAREQIHAAAERLSAAWPEARRLCRWVAADSYHVTLRFLGECPEARLSSLEDAMRDTARLHRPYALSLNGFGTFNQGKSLKVLWIGVEEGKTETVALAADLMDRLAARGFPRDKTPFHPHVTLARAKGALPARSMPALGAPGIEPVRATRLTLMRSTLLPHGAQYDALCSIRLSG